MFSIITDYWRPLSAFARIEKRKDGMKKALMLVWVGLLMSGCAGKAANSAQVNESGDAALTCEDVQDERSALDERAKELIVNTGVKISFGETDLDFVLPWFHSDFSDAGRIEANAMIERYRQLRKVANAKRCR